LNKYQRIFLSKKAQNLQENQELFYKSI